MDEVLKQLQEKLSAAVLNVKQEIVGIRSNRPTPQLIENIRAEYFGQSLPLKQLGTIGIQPPREIHVTAWDVNAVAAIAKAIESSPLHLSPQIEGNTVRMNLPPLTDERREEVRKLVKSLAEKWKIKMRGDRDDANKKMAELLTQKKISEDQKFSFKKKVQEHMDRANEDIEKTVESKLAEINE